MVKARDSVGVRLELVVVVHAQQLVQLKEVFKVGQYVLQVQYKLKDVFSE